MSPISDPATIEKRRYFLSKVRDAKASCTRLSLSPSLFGTHRSGFSAMNLLEQREQSKVAAESERSERASGRESPVWVETERRLPMMHLHLVPLIRQGLQFARIRRRASEDERARSTGQRLRSREPPRSLFPSV